MIYAEIRIILTIFVSAFLPIILLLLLRSKLKIWIFKYYFTTLIICILGWELWFTYGILGGDTVEIRRSEFLNSWIPQNINWLLNSLADAGTVCLGGLLLTYLIFRRSTEIFTKWQLGPFIVFYSWCLLQNVYVELFVYQDQLAQGNELSWAPLSPAGNLFNPMLFQWGNKSLYLQTQMPWILFGPIAYWLAIKFAKKN